MYHNFNSGIKCKLDSKTLSGGFKRYRSEFGKISKVPGQQFTRQGKSFQFAANQVLSFAQIENLCDRIDSLYVGSSHTDVWQKQVWKDMYGYIQNGGNHLKKVDNKGNMIAAAEPAIACHNCGIVIPAELAQVDHHMPQDDKDSLAILKMLRAFGYTKAKGSGRKSQNILLNQGGGGLAQLELNPKGRDRTYNHLGDVRQTDKGKYDSTLEGDCFISIINALHPNDEFKSAKRICQNSFLNLVPLCSSCNGTKRDWIRQIW